jgi:deoxyribonuclease (pyrimidine dimer)
MTRINTVEPSELLDQHLLAELREMVRLPKNLHISLNRASKPFSEVEIPRQYVLGSGHVKFFYNKFKWLENRFLSLLVESDKRGFNINFRDVTIFRNVPTKYYKDWEATKDSLELNRDKLQERIEAKPDFYRYYGSKL